MITLNGSNGSTSATATLTINKPTCAAGDLLLAVLGNSEASGASYALPDGWTILFERSGGNIYYGDIRVYYKVATGSEPASYNFISSLTPRNGHNGCIISFSGVDTSNIFNAYDSAVNSNSANSSHIAPAIVTTVDNAYVLRGWSYRNGVATWTTKPALDDDIWQATGNRPNMLVMGEIQASAGNTGTATAIATNTYRDATFTLALTPASGGEPTVTGQIKVYNGSTNETKPIKQWNGSAWVVKPLKHYNGSAFVETNY